MGSSPKASPAKEDAPPASRPALKGAGLLGKLDSFRSTVTSGVKDFSAQAMNEARDALKEGKALARAAAKNRSQGAGLSGGWDGAFGSEFQAADGVEQALNEASEVVEMLEQLKEGNADDEAVAAVEARLAGLQAHVATMEQALRESRLDTERVNVERDKLARQLKEKEKALAAAEALASERGEALAAEAARAAELAERVEATQAESSKEQEDAATRWQAKVVTLNAELETARGEAREAAAGAAAARVAQHEAEAAKEAAEARAEAAEAAAAEAAAEMAQLRALSSAVEEKSAQWQQDNERRKQTFNTAVEAQVQRFKAGLEAERNAALARAEDAASEAAALQERLVEAGAKLAAAEGAAEEAAAATATQRARVAEYEQLVGTLRGQVEAASAKAETAATELKEAREAAEKSQETLKSEVEAVALKLQQAEERAAQAEAEAAAARRDAAERRMGAETALETASKAREEADTAAAEVTALKVQVSQLQRELESARAAAATVAATPQASPSKPLPVSTSLPGTPPPAAFDLESLRRTPLLPIAAPPGRRQERKAVSGGLGASTRNFVFAYMALVHVLLLVAMGRASHAHLACEHLHVAAGVGAGGLGGLP